MDFRALLGWYEGYKFFWGLPNGSFSPLKKLSMRVHARLAKLGVCKWYFSPIFTQPDQIELFLLVLSNKFLKNGYKHTGTLFLGSSYHYLFKNIAHVRGICKLYFCICICVFVYLYCVFACQRLVNIIIWVLVPLFFQKYSTCWVHLQI